MRIAEIRKSIGLSRRGFAKLVGVHSSTADDWENGGHMPRASRLPKIAEVLNCTIDDILSVCVTNEEESKNAEPQSH